MIYFAGFHTSGCPSFFMLFIYVFGMIFVRKLDCYLSISMFVCLSLVNFFVFIILISRSTSHWKCLFWFDDKSPSPFFKRKYTYLLVLMVQIPIFTPIYEEMGQHGGHSEFQRVKTQKIFQAFHDIFLVNFFSIPRPWRSWAWCGCPSPPYIQVCPSHFFGGGEGRGISAFPETEKLFPPIPPSFPLIRFAHPSPIWISRLSTAGTAFFLHGLQSTGPGPRPVLQLQLGSLS